MKVQERFLAREALCHCCGATLGTVQHLKAGMQAFSYCSSGLLWTQNQIKDEEKSCINKQALSIQISQGVTTYFILRTRLLCKRCKWHSLHVIFLMSLPLSMFQRVILVELRRVAHIEEITSEDVTRHPRLLAAKQRKGFPNMVKQSGCSAWRGVSAARGASCFLFTLLVRDFPSGDCFVRQIVTIAMNSDGLFWWEQSLHACVVNVCTACRHWFPLLQQMDQDCSTSSLEGCVKSNNNVPLKLQLHGTRFQSR